MDDLLISGDVLNIPLQQPRPPSREPATNAPRISLPDQAAGALREPQNATFLDVSRNLAPGIAGRAGLEWERGDIE